MSTTTQPITAIRPSSSSRVAESLLKRYAALQERNVPVKPFEVAGADGMTYRIGSGEPAFTVRLITDAGVKAVASFDELTIAEAFMNGDLDIEGNLLQALRYRAMVSDRRPIRYLLSTYVIAALTGQIRSDKRWIKSHYDIDADFFLLWLDQRIRGYSHGYFERDDESLEDGMERKFRYAM